MKYIAFVVIMAIILLLIVLRRLKPGWRSYQIGKKAIGYVNKGEYDKAIADCTKALELDPKSVLQNENVQFHNQLLLFNL